MSDNISGLNKNLTEHLLSRLSQPGVTRLHMAEAITDRIEKMTEPLPLITNLEERWQSVLEAQDDLPPLVYVQPSPAPGVTSVPAQAANRRSSRPQETAVSLSIASATPLEKAPAPDLIIDSSKPKTKQVLDTEKSSQPDKISTQSAKQAQKLVKPSAPIESTNRPKSVSVDEASVTASAATRAASAVGSSPITKPSQRELTLPTKLTPSVDQPAPAAPPASVTQKAVDPLPVATTSLKVAAAPAPVNADNSQPELVVVMPKARATAQPKTGVEAKNAGPTLVKSTQPKVDRGRKSPDKSAASLSDKPKLPVVKPHAPAPKAAVSTPSAPPTPPAAPSTPTTLPLVRPWETVPGKAHPDLPLPPVVSPQSNSVPGKASGSAKRMVAPRPTPAVPASNVIQREADPAATNDDTADSPPATVDVDEIVEEVQRQFMRQLAIESERRGVTSWQ